MLFARLSVVATLFASAFAHSTAPVSSNQHNLSKRLTVAASSSISAALETATSEIHYAGTQIETALAGVESGDAQAVVESVSVLLTEIHTSLAVLSSAVVTVSKRSLINHAVVDVHALALLVAGLLNTLVVALKPIQLLCATDAHLKALLAPLLAHINSELSLVCNGLFGLVAGLHAVVLTLVSGTVLPVLKGLGLSTLVASLGL